MAPAVAGGGYGCRGCGCWLLQRLLAGAAASAAHAAGSGCGRGSFRGGWRLWLMCVRCGSHVGGGSRRSRRGRRRGTRGTGGAATTTTRRRGAPRASLPPFPRGRRWRSPGLFLSSRGEVRMDPGPGGRAGWGRRRIGGTEGTATRMSTRRRRRAVLRLLFLGEGDEGALASSSPVSLGGDVGPESISACTNN